MGLKLSSLFLSLVLGEVYADVCVYMFVSVCVFVREREREREILGGWEYREGAGWPHTSTGLRILY